MTLALEQAPLPPTEIKELYPKTVRDNLLFRIEFHRNCEQRKEARTAAIALFQKNPVAFFDLSLWTYDPRELTKDRPFILYRPFQEDYVNSIDKDIVSGESSLTEKTRDMGVTWMILGKFLRRWLLFDENFLVGSRKEDLVDKLGDMSCHFEKIRYMIKNLPGWMLEAFGIDTEKLPFMRIYKKNGAAITGESMNENFSRQGRYKAILLDEFAFVESAETIWTACGDSAPCKMVVSTPHGNLNKFARLRHEGKIKVYTLHWKLHPKKTEEWYESECTMRSEQDVAQELDINYNVSAGKPFYIGFSRSVHVRKIGFNPQLELIRGWDYGYLHPASTFFQRDVKGRLIWLDTCFGNEEQIEDFGNRVKQYLSMDYPTIIGGRDYGDPAGNQESDKSRKTSAQILHSLGFQVYSRPSNTNETNYNARKNIVERLLKTLIDGLPALIINDTPNNQIAIEAFEGGYHYPDENKYGFIKESPVKDGYYEHVMNAFEYVVVNMFAPLPRKNAPFKRNRGPKNMSNI